MSLFSDVASLLKKGKKRRESDKQERNAYEDTSKKCKWKPMVEITSKLNKKEHMIAWKIEDFENVKHGEPSPEIKVTVFDPNGQRSNWTFKLLTIGTGFWRLGRIQRKLNWVEGWIVEVDELVPLLGPVKMYYHEDTPYHATMTGPTVYSSLDYQISDNMGNIYFSNVGRISTVMMDSSRDDAYTFEWNQLPVRDDGSLVIQLKFWLYSAPQTARVIRQDD